MSGPLPADEPYEGAADGPGPSLEVTPSRTSTVGSMTVRRALPKRGRRTVGPWCFADHLGPTAGGDDGGIGPHPHIGLQTVTWLVAGELVHRDSLGSEQPIRPGQLNLMTAGRGIAHAEESAAATGALHGIQLWIAQPERTRHGEAEFEHVAEPPATEVGGATATVLVGSFAGATSPARADTDHVGVELVVRSGSVELPVRPLDEHALVVLDGTVELDGQTVGPGHLGYLAPGHDELRLSSREGARLVLLGGPPFESPVVIWWNFVGRSHAEIDEAAQAWESGSDRFGPTGSQLAPLPVPDRPWSR